MSPAKASESEKFLRLIGPEFHPYYYYTEDKIPAGNLVDLFDLIVTNAGYRWDGQLTPAARTMRMLIRGLGDASILVKNPILEESGAILTSPKPVSAMILNVYGQGDLSGVRRPEDLSGKHVVVMRGYGYGGIRAWLDDPANNVRLTEADTPQSTILFAGAGRADVALLYNVNYQFGMAILAEKAPKLQAATVARVPLFLHVNKNSVTDAPQVMNDLLMSYQGLVDDGVLAPSDTVAENVIKGSGGT